ncbi:hypothetical protein GNI_183590 [Gregarina niphandrodes]|uniref:Uncharacterized protein n=1 Tax=Gregarina niphandrodes TaxID=110365 RepID=A0A023AY22_GRENI|nr:hypothetical protein GNI_183590 [Gregarina niphandrodes]EZG43190.1 hypothetical protein GNI_183590 [Gregarina niphandrodes]|eukprot:XP_011133558.1 hypothetical protein GNI_183590 [Gregarina niphandrodes]
MRAPRSRDVANWVPGVLAVGAGVCNNVVEKGSIDLRSLPPESMLKPLATESLRTKSSLVVSGTGRSKETVYWNNDCRCLTQLSITQQVFQDVDDAKVKLNELLSEEEWKNLKRITQADLWKCKLVYVELAAIISLFVDCPFGRVTERAERNVSDWLQGVGGFRVQNHWIAGCLLQCAGVSTRKIIDFIVDTLGYIPAKRRTSLECLGKGDLRYPTRRTVGDTRQLLLEREKILAAAPITARQFVEQIFPMVSPCLSELRAGVPRQVGPKRRTQRPRSPAVYLPRAGCLRKPRGGAAAAVASLKDAPRKARKLLGERAKKLLRIGVEDFEACSLDYVELGTIVDQRVRDAFGYVSRSVLVNTAATLEESTRSSHVNGWIAGCLLQYAEVPVLDLVDFCVQELKYAPSMLSRLECLKHSNARFRAWRTNARNPRARLQELLRGLHEKISLSQFKRLTSLNVDEQANFVFASHHPPFRSLDALDCTPSPLPPPSRPPPSLSSPSPPALKRTNASRTPGSPPQTMDPIFTTDPTVRDRDLLDPAMMYCHPDDLIQYLKWVEWDYY